MSASKVSLDALEDAARRLHHQWEASTQDWRDSVQRDFAQRYLEPLQQEERRMTQSSVALLQAVLQAQRAVH